MDIVEQNLGNIVERLHDDPHYEAMECDVRKRTNLDPELADLMRAAKASEFTTTWHKIRQRYFLSALDVFVAEHVEQSRHYAAEWDAFAALHPEVESLNKDALAAWELEHADQKPFYPNTLYEYRQIARAFHEYENAQRRLQSNAGTTANDIGGVLV